MADMGRRMTETENNPSEPPKPAETATPDAPNQDWEADIAALSALHPADAADLVENLDGDGFKRFSSECGGLINPDIIVELSSAKQEIFLAQQPKEGIADLLANLPSDDATALFSKVGEDRILSVLEAVSPQAREQLVNGLSFDENSAGRLMQREFVALPAFWTVEKALSHIRTPQRANPSIFYEIYIIDTAHHVTGAIQLAHLVTADTDIELETLMKPILSDIRVNQDQEDVAFQFRKYSLASAPVRDEENRLVGMITVDDMVHVLQAEHSEDLLALSNVTGKKRSGVWPAIRGRTPWLLLNLLTAIGVSGVISLFEATLDALVFLAIMMPIIAVIGGNAGNQALAVAIRDMTEKTLEGKNLPAAIWREVFVAMINGVLIGVALGLAAYFWRGDALMAIIITASMLFTIMWGGLLGILVPLGLRRIGADPAVASSVFVLSLTDLAAFFSFLGLASVFLI